MRFIITDLEWNGSYTRKTHGYFNEIIEIGAVKTDEHWGNVETFRAIIRPALSRKLSHIVTDLTNITPEELADGIPFDQAMTLFAQWIGDEEAIFATWSNTDLLVMMENCRYYYGDETIPFATHYADLQRFCQQQLGVDLSHQLGLGHAAEMLSISDEGMALHRALDDSILTARVLKQVFDAAKITPHIFPMNAEFYERLRFKPYIINDIDHPAVQKQTFRFHCEGCGRKLTAKSKFKFRNRAFCADLECRSCDRKYLGRVQVRQLYDSVECKQKLIEKKPKEEMEETVT